MKVGISRVVKEDLLTGKSKYIKDSYLIFNHIQVDMEKDMLVVSISYDDELLATIKQEAQPFLGSVHFKLLDGQMKMDIA